MVWFHIEDIWLGFPELFDGLVGCLEAQSLQLLGEVVSDEPVADMAAQFIDRRVTEGFDGGLLDGAHHPFGLAVGPWVIGLGRSEEHTSELQSLMRISYSVFGLEKKRNRET